ncbi:MAG: hypothetical protein ABJK37_09185 [Paraglaciecola sp.]|uniref:hypothetical protein n=1 Tax=Paraglaciecola sp. TaxID=1920173 RepID=UPI003297C546
MKNVTSEPRVNAIYTNSKSTPRQLTKLDSMLLRFANGQKLNRFDAERIGDHCLPSTVSDLQKRNALTFCRKLVKVPNRFGSRTSVMMYWLEGESLLIARKIIKLNSSISTT